MIHDLVAVLAHTRKAVHITQAQLAERAGLSRGGRVEPGLRSAA